MKRYISFAAFVLLSVWTLASCGGSEDNEDEVKPDEISVSTNNLTLTVGSTEAIGVTVYPRNATNTDIIVSSSNEKVVRVLDGGNVRQRAVYDTYVDIQAVGVGTATITITAKGNKKLSEKVVVTVEDLAWDPTTELKPDPTAVSGLQKGADGKFYLLDKIGSSQISYLDGSQWIEFYGDDEWMKGMLRSSTYNYTYTVDSKGRLASLTCASANSKYKAEYTNFTYNANGLTSVKFKTTNTFSDYTSVEEGTRRYTWSDGNMVKEEDTYSSLRAYNSGDRTNLEVTTTYTYTYDKSKENVAGCTIFPGTPQVSSPFFNVSPSLLGGGATRHLPTKYVAVTKSVNTVSGSSRTSSWTREYSYDVNAAGLPTSIVYRDSDEEPKQDHMTSYSFKEYKRK